ncbi:toprim domain-containing protein [Candidatus Woesearchaeota archaeon]|nr:toprim domain-containing protein [Candidatus Woesearchaeota archaeon]
MNQEEKEVVKEVYEAIDKLKDLPVIVEGKKDKKALEAIGFKKVITLNKALYKVCEEISDKKVMILTDLDKEGKQIYGRLKKDLNKRGVLVDDKLRNLLFRTSLRQIEGLTHYLDKLDEL